MVWTKEYDTIEGIKLIVNEKLKAQIDKVLKYARGNITYGCQKEENDFVIISIEGYKCIALISDGFSPIEICERVFPFDENEIYPMQEIEQVIQFKKGN